MPTSPIVDAHLHLWDPTHLRMPWLDGQPLLNRPFTAADYREHTAGLDIAAMVYVQTDVASPYGLLEAEWVVEQAAAEPRIQGIVAYAPLEYGERARAYLAALRRISPLIKGIRRLYQAEPVDFCLDPDFIRGVQLLPDYGFSFDICIKHQHLENTLTLVRRCPDTAFILDHLGKPDIASGQLDPWRDQLRQLAAFPNVMCKISGAVTEADHRWSVDDLRPFVEHALAVFGEDRVVFGGDWPVVLNAAPYRRWVEALDAITVGRSADAQRKLWAENARRFYRLPAV